MAIKQWFAELSSRRPPDNPTSCSALKCPFQKRTASNLLTLTTVSRPINARIPGLDSSSSSTAITDSADRSLSDAPTLRASIPQAWSSLSCVWDLRRFNNPVIRTLKCDVRFDRYESINWFFASLTVLSEITRRVSGIFLPLSSDILLQSSRVKATISIIALASCLVDSSMTNSRNCHPWLVLGSSSDL